MQCIYDMPAEFHHTSCAVACDLSIGQMIQRGGVEVLLLTCKLGTRSSRGWSMF